MTHQNQPKLRRLHQQMLLEHDPKQMLDVLLALDQMLVEVSMRMYNVPRHERHTVRAQNRRLHDAVRKHLPRLLKPSRT